MAMQKMLVGISTRRYSVGLEPVGQRTERVATATKLPDHLARHGHERMRAAYHAESALAAQAQLEAPAHELECTHPGAAASLREGTSETLTVLRLGVPPTLARILRSTNSIESMISIARTYSANVKHWQNGQMVLRWCAAGMAEAGKQPATMNP
jgi:putative transposase